MQWLIYATLAANWAVLGWLVIRQEQRTTLIMATLNERLTAVETALDEAGTEIVAELAKLREQLGAVTPETDAILVRLEGKAKALADIIPNAPPVT